MTMVDAIVTTVENQHGISDKYYRTYVVGDYALFQFGRRWVIGQGQVSKHANNSTARSAAAAKILSKERGGYENKRSKTVQVSLEDFERVVGLNERAAISWLATQCGVEKSGVVTPIGEPRPVPLNLPDNVPVPSAESVEDPLQVLTTKLLDAIGKAGANPKTAMVAYATLRAEVEALDGAVRRAQSYFETLELMVEEALIA